MPSGRRMRTVDERIVRAPVDGMFELARAVEAWPTHLALSVSPDARCVDRTEADWSPWRPTGPSGRFAGLSGGWQRCRWFARRRKTQHPVSPRGRNYSRHGRRMVVHPMARAFHPADHAPGDLRAYRTRVGRAAVAARGSHGGKRRHWARCSSMRSPRARSLAWQRSLNSASTGDSRYIRMGPP